MLENFKRLLTESLNVDEQVALLKTLPGVGISAHELAAAATFVLDQSIAVPFHDDSIVDIVGTGGDNSNTFNISTTAAFIVAGSGIKVAKHGNRAVTSRSGGFDLLQALDIDIPEEPAQALAQLQAHGLTFLFAPFFHPSFKRISEARKILASEKKKTVFNFLGPLVNPGRVKRAAIGVFDSGLIKPFIEALKELGFIKAMVFHGNGMDELSLSGTDKMAVLDHDRIYYQSITADDLGLMKCEREDLIGGDASDNAAITRAILSGEEQGAKRDVVLLNAAAAISVGSTMNLVQAIESARNSIDTGRALAKLNALSKPA